MIEKQRPELVNERRSEVGDALWDFGVTQRPCTEVGVGNERRLSRHGTGPTSTAEPVEPSQWSFFVSVGRRGSARPLDPRK